MEAEVAPYILTLEMDDRSQGWFDGLRRERYPAGLNQIAAHLTLCHHLPQSAEVRDAVAKAAQRPGFAMRVSGLRSLGRGVAYGIESAELMGVHRAISAAFQEWLTPQDRQGFRPHVVVQNKVTGAEARALKERLEGEFKPFEVKAEGLALWLYLGGPWELAERFPFL